MLLWFTHTQITLLYQQVDFDIVYQPLLDLIFCINQKLNKRGRVRINLTARCVRVTIVAVETLITYSECVFVSVVIQRVKRMPRTVWPYFSTLYHKWHEFREKFLNIKMCVLIFCITLCEMFLILIGFQRRIVINLHVKYLLFLSDFNETWIFSTDIRQTPKYKISWKSVNWEPSCSIRRARLNWNVFK
jgi:hypothetical protein